MATAPTTAATAASAIATLAPATVATATATPATAPAAATDDVGVDNDDDETEEADPSARTGAENGDTAPKFSLNNGARMTIATDDSFYGSEADPSAKKRWETPIVAKSLRDANGDPDEGAVDNVDRLHLYIWGADEADDPDDRVNGEVDRLVVASDNGVDDDRQA